MTSTIEHFINKAKPSSWPLGLPAPTQIHNGIRQCREGTSSVCSCSICCSQQTVFANLNPLNFTKVANISSLVTEQILRQMFQFLGDVEELKFPHGDGLQEALVEFKEASSAMTALHLSGTELGDRILFVSANYGSLSVDSSSLVSPQARTFPPLGPHPNLTLRNTPVTATTAQVAALRALNPVINPTVAQFDPQKAEEISRTVYIGNISSVVTEQELTHHFAACGPVAYVKMAGDPAQPTRFAFLEFATVTGAHAALSMNGLILADRPLKVNHSKNAINKTPKKNESQDVLAAMRRVQEAQRRIASRLGVEAAAAENENVTASGKTSDDPTAIGVADDRAGSASAGRVQTAALGCDAQVVREAGRERGGGIGLVRVPGLGSVVRSLLYFFHLHPPRLN
ncbi:hypothetical protein BC938DRAFT_476131 [Jimgerdemannia flammicorona]|uniref:RRM domain-containing protein n=1 Tax=Jimgerdemannia flammicorona TaxID=994334 RepID=A0A433QQY0_9FUNG|nr:hypothetical protein BC938DRAFT_476131 [Jimgerdemannia flammicorona]